MSWVQHLLTFVTGGLYHPAPKAPPPPQRPEENGLSRREKQRRCSEDLQKSLVILRKERNGATELRDLTCRLDTTDPKYRDLIESSRNGSGA